MSDPAGFDPFAIVASGQADPGGVYYEQARRMLGKVELAAFVEGYRAGLTRPHLSVRLL
jgi:hypothetical protein